MIINEKNYSFTQPVCTNCWMEDNTSVVDGEPKVRIPIRATANEQWIDDLEICCKCGHATTSRVFIRIDPSTVDYPTEDE